MPKGKGKQRKRIRQRRWDADKDLDTASREPRRVQGRETGIGAPIEQELDLDACFTDMEPNGLVVSPYGVLAFVETGEQEVLCQVADHLTDGRTSVLAPGDAVLVERQGDDYVVQAVRNRRSKLSRPSPRYAGREQVFAANVDQLIIVSAVAQPYFKTGVVDRYLIAAQIGGVSPVLCVNKVDLSEQEIEAVEGYRELGLPVIETSCVTGDGVAALRDAIEGKTNIFAGQSGVGKSSLLNALDPDLELRTQGVSNATSKGRHTTTASRLYHLEVHTHVIDTPGIKQLGLWQVSAENLDYYFPEIGRLAANCKFRDCTHSHEPNCSVKQAVEDGDVTMLRYQSYHRIRGSLEETLEP